MGIVYLPRYMTDGEIEARAQQMLSAYQLAFNVEISEPPIPVVHLIEAYLGLGILWDTITERDGERILAYIDPKIRKIRMNAKHGPLFDRFFGTEAFTLGHEVGHWDLHIVEAEGTQLSLFGDAQSTPFICRGDRDSRLEWQANRFSAALIMPKEMIHKCIASVDICVWPNLYDLKDHFGVTISAFTRRLQELGLIYKSPAGDLYPSYESYAGQSSLL